MVLLVATKLVKSKNNILNIACINICVSLTNTPSVDVNNVTEAVKKNKTVHISIIE